MEIISSKSLKSEHKNLDEEFHNRLLSFIDKLENKDVFDIEEYDYLSSYEINMGEFHKMIDSIKIFAFDDEYKDEINFPYEDWIARISTIWYLA